MVVEQDSAKFHWFQDLKPCKGGMVEHTDPWWLKGYLGTVGSRLGFVG